MVEQWATAVDGAPSGAGVGSHKIASVCSPECSPRVSRNFIRPRPSIVLVLAALSSLHVQFSPHPPLPGENVCCDERGSSHLMTLLDAKRARQ